MNNMIYENKKLFDGTVKINIPENYEEIPLSELKRITIDTNKMFCARNKIKDTIVLQQIPYRETALIHVIKYFDFGIKQTYKNVEVISTKCRTLRNCEQHLLEYSGEFEMKKKYICIVLLQEGQNRFVLTMHSGYERKKETEALLGFMLDTINISCDI